MADTRDAARTTPDGMPKDPTIRSRVVTLVAISLLPFIGMMTWLATDYAGVQRRVIEVERVAVAEKISRLTEREIAAIEGVLIGLGGSDDLTSADFTRFAKHAEHVAKQPHIDVIRVFNPSGTEVYSTNRQPEKPALAANRADIINRVITSKKTVIGFAPNNPSGPHAFSVTVPVERGGTPIYAIAADVRPDRLSNLFMRAGLQPNWIAAVVDGSGHFVARSLSPDQYVGRLARPEVVVRAIAGDQRGDFENVTHEGTATSNSFQKSALTGWMSVVAVPKEILNAPYRRSMAFVLLGSAAISLLSLAAAILMAARISEPIRQLRNVATALIEGKPPPDAELKIAELNDVRAALHEAIEKKEHLAAIVASSGDAIMSVGLDGCVRSWNQGAEKLFGYSAAEMVGHPKTIVVPEDKRNELSKHISVISSGESMRTETVRSKRDGTLIDVSLDMSPIRGANGNIIAMSSIIHDITSRKAAEKHQRFLMRELTHRSKNLLAIVQSMARQTARSASSLKDFETRYMYRLQGLAASHDLLVNQNWVGAPLDELIRKQVDAFAETSRMNIAISGPDVMISAKAAQTIGLALHELATNSMKYGALSTPQGRVAIEWQYLTHGNASTDLELSWQEFGGPPVSPPEKKGFGHFVIERMAIQSLNAKVKIDFQPEGLIWVLTVPIANLENEPEFEGADSIG